MVEILNDASSPEARDALTVFLNLVAAHGTDAYAGELGRVVDDIGLRDSLEVRLGKTAMIVDVAVLVISVLVDVVEIHSDVDRNGVLRHIDKSVLEVWGGGAE